MFMITQDKFTKTGQARKIEELHYDSQHWKSLLLLMQDELVFIEHLLNSYVFEPRTPNLFERLQGYLYRLGKAKTNKKEVRESIAFHEKNLQGMMQCTDDTCDLTYYQKHKKLEAEVVDCMEDFKGLKTEIFNYAGGILKQRKPE